MFLYETVAIAERPKMATRAEARRRKILENSEDRLKRLTGRVENDSIRGKCSVQWV